MRTSYSALNTFKQCPQKFKFQIIDKIKAPKSPEALFGSAVHSTLKFMFSRNPLFPTLDEIVSSFLENWRTASAKMQTIAPSLSGAYEESGKEMLKNFFKRNPPWALPVVDTESRFEVLIPDHEGGQHVLAGIIDRIDKIGDGEYEITDYKTNRRLPSQQAADENLQMSIYHMALKNRWPNVEPAKIKLSLYFLKHNEKISSYRTAEDLKSTRESVLASIKTIEKNLADSGFMPNPSALCDWCAYKPICPAWKHLYKKEGFPAPDEAQLQQALSEYFAIKEVGSKNAARTKELQEIIKAYMGAHKVDRVFDERGYYISKKLQQRFKYDFDKIREILLNAGLEDKWGAILEADEKKLKQIMASLPSPIKIQIENQKKLDKEYIILSTSSKPTKI